MALTISQATQPVLDFRNAKTEQLNRVSIEVADETRQQTLQAVSQGNQIASNSTAVLSGRGSSIDFQA